MRLPILEGTLIDIPEYQEITEDMVYCPLCFHQNKRRIIFLDDTDIYYKCKVL